MTLVTGTVQDLGYDGMEGTLWARPARFRSDGQVVYAPERKPFKITGGVVSAELAPGPAVLELQVGSHARTTFEVVIPEADTTLADLLDSVFVWEPAQVSLFVAEREAAERARAEAEAAAGQAATAAQQTGQDRSHVDQVRTELEEAYDASEAGQALPPRLTEAALNATYGTKAEVAEKLDETDADARYALKTEVSVSGVSATQTLMATLDRGVDDATILLVGDSTGDSNVEWYYRLAERLADDWPDHRVIYHRFNHTELAYDAGTELQAGSGPTLRFYNASLAGANSREFLGAKFNLVIRDVQPDILMMSLMHNEQLFAGTPNSMLGRWMSLLESATQVVPHADVVLVAQNPAAANDDQQRRARHLQTYAAERGFGFIDVLQHFLDNRPESDGWTADGIHPNAEGTLQWTNVVHAHFRRDPRAQPVTRQPSSFLVAAENFIPDGAFHTYEGPGAPTGWTINNLTVTKDTTRYDSPKGYSLKLSGISDGQATMNYNFPGIGPAQAMQGQWVTVAVRMFVPSGSPAGFGRIAVVAGGVANNEPSQTAGQGGWRWAVMPVYVHPDGGGLQLIIYANVSSTGLAEINVDRVVLARGVLPRDVVL